MFKDLPTVKNTLDSVGATFFEGSEGVLLRTIVSSYILSKVLTILFEQLNIWIHLNACEGNNLDLKLNTMQHLLSLDQHSKT